MCANLSIANLLLFVYPICNTSIVNQHRFYTIDLIFELQMMQFDGMINNIKNYVEYIK